MDRIAIEVENPLYGTLLDLVIVWGAQTTVRVKLWKFGVNQNTQNSVFKQEYNVDRAQMKLNRQSSPFHAWKQWQP